MNPVKTLEEEVVYCRPKGVQKFRAKYDWQEYGAQGLISRMGQIEVETEEELIEELNSLDVEPYFLTVEAVIPYEVGFGQPGSGIKELKELNK